MENLCSKCSAPYVDGQKFCRKCGNKLIAPDLFCPECGAKCRPDDSFCPECGTCLTSDAPSDAWSAAAGDVWGSATGDEWGSALGSLSAFEEQERLASFDYEKLPDGSIILKGAKNKYAISIDIPRGVTVIADRAFENSGVIEVTLPEGLTTVGVRAFYNCNNLTALRLPSSVAMVGDEAFADCEKLTVTMEGPVRVMGEDALRGTVNEKNDAEAMARRAREEREAQEARARAEREAREARARAEREEAEARARAEREEAEARARNARNAAAVEYARKNAHAPRPSCFITDEILSSLRELSASGDNEATITLAKCALMGVGMRKSRPEALSCLNRLYADRTLPYHGEVTYLLGEYYADRYLGLNREYWESHGSVDFGPEFNYEQAEKFYREALDEGYADAAMRLAYLFYGLKLTYEEERNAGWHEKADELKAQAQKMGSVMWMLHNIQQRIYRDKGVEKAYNEIKAITGDTPELLFACAWAITDHEQFRKIPEQRAIATDFYFKAAEMGHDRACNPEGVHVIGVFSFSSNEERIAHLKKYADRGSSFCAYHLGLAYHQGEHRNQEQAIVEFTRAYDKGYSRRPDPSDSMYNSIHYLIDRAYWESGMANNHRVDYDKRFCWIKRWVEDEPWCPHAFSALSSFYEDGRGVAENKRMAFELLQRGAAASDRSDNPCFERLGACYLYGNLNTPKDPKLALQWLERVSPKNPSLEATLKKLREGTC